MPIQTMWLSLYEICKYLKVSQTFLWDETPPKPVRFCFNLLLFQWDSELMWDLSLFSSVLYVCCLTTFHTRNPSSLFVTSSLKFKHKSTKKTTFRHHQPLSHSAKTHSISRLLTTSCTKWCSKTIKYMIILIYENFKLNRNW